MKWLVFFSALIFGVPLGYSYAKNNSKVEHFIIFLMIFFTAKNIDVNFISREWLRGTSRGFSIGLLDLCALIIFLLVIYRRNKHPMKVLPPGSILYFLYLIFSLLSIFNSDLYLMSFFEIWRMMKMYFFYWVLYNYFTDLKQIDLVMKYISIIIFYIGFEVLKQKYIGGIFQTPGPFDHQNSLVMYLNIFNSMVFAYVLNRKGIKTWYWFTVFGLGAICTVSTLSRGGMALFAISVAMILFVSFTKGFSAKKVGITLVLLTLATAFVIKAMDSVVERFQNAPEESANTRVDLAIAAKKMANDKFLGIGVNNFGHKIKPPYPYCDHIDYDEDNIENSSNLILVETVYMMIAAETGWHNLVIFIIWIFLFYGINLKNLKRYKGSGYEFLPIGLLGGFTAIYLESVLEWVMKQTNNFYQLMFAFALVASMAKIAKLRTTEKRKFKSPPRTNLNQS